MSPYCFSSGRVYPLLTSPVLCRWFLSLLLMSLFMMMVLRLSWKEQIACESRRQSLPDSASLPRSGGQLRGVQVSPSPLARVLDPLGWRESWLYSPGALFANTQHIGQVTEPAFRPLPLISRVLSLPLRYDSLSIKCWSRWSKTGGKYMIFFPPVSLFFPP